MGRTVPRPIKKSEHVIFFDGPRVEKGWNDCVSQVPNAMADAWDQLTTDPLDKSDRQYQLQGSLATKTMDGKPLPQWQYKISGGGRIRYLVDTSPVLDGRGRPKAAGRVVIVDASPGHPKDTEKRKGRR